MSLYKFDNRDGSVILLDANNTMNITRTGIWFKVFYFKDIKCFCLVTTASPSEMDYDGCKPEISKACEDFATYLRDLWRLTEDPERKVIYIEQMSEVNRIKNLVLHEL